MTIRISFILPVIMIAVSVSLLSLNRIICINYVQIVLHFSDWAGRSAKDLAQTGSEIQHMEKALNKDKKERKEGHSE